MALKNAGNLLRKRRKWPLSPYKAKWHETFNQLQAMETLKHSKQPYLPQTLLHSFSIYNCHPTPDAYNFIITTHFQKTPDSHHHLLPILDRLQKIETFETPEVIFVNLIKGYVGNDMVDEAVDLFFRIREFRCVPTVSSLNALILPLCRRRDWIVRVPEILRRSCTDLRIRIEMSSFRILIAALCRISRASDAITLLNCMLSDGYAVDFECCSVILSCLCEKCCDLDNVELMLGFLRNMRRIGFVPDMVDSGTVIKLLVKSKKAVDALHVLNQIKLDRIKPSVACYTMVMKGMIVEEDYEKAGELFDEMLVLGLVPDIRTYNVYIKGLCKQDNVEAGYNMLVCMQKLGCKPDLITYNTLLTEFCKLGKIIRARELMKEMGLKGVSLNSQSYKIMIDGMISEGEIMEAYVLFEEMLDKCVYPHSSIIDKIICVLCEKRLCHKLTQLLEKMSSKGIAPGAIGWETMLLNLGCQDRFAEITLINLINPTQYRPIQLLEG